MSRRQIISSAEGDFKYIGQTYQIREQVDGWCRQIADEAHRPQRPMTGPGELSVEEVLAKLELDSASSDSSWIDDLGRFLRLHSNDIDALKKRISAYPHAHQQRLNYRVFGGLDGSVPVEVWVLYDVNPDEGTATFLWLEAYTPDRQDLDRETRQQRRPW
jgi:hypothetical protein